MPLTRCGPGVSRWLYRELQRGLFTTATRRKQSEVFDRHRRENEIATAAMDACFRIHRELGPGLLESTYQACLAHELKHEGLQFECEVALPVRYRGLDIDVGYRIDMIVEDMILIEKKSIRALLPVHDAQLLTYLKLSGRRLGYLINWNVPLLKDGIRRLVNGC